MTANAKLPQLGNQAGLFADSDSTLGTGIVGLGSSLINRSKSAGVTSGSFEGVEKPLLFEVATQGLVKGFPVYSKPGPQSSMVKVRCWDNIHWWGARGPGAPMMMYQGRS